MDQDMSAILQDDSRLQRASGPELSRAAAFCRQLARQATTPQEREFYADRAYELSLRAVGA